MGQEFEDKRNPTLSRLVDNYFEYQEQRLRSALEQGTGKHLSRQSIDQYQWTIEKYIRPAWPEIPIKNIQRADVKLLVREVAKENTEYVANGVLMRIRGLMRFALDDDLIEHDPSRDVRTDYQYIPVERSLTEEEIRAFWFGLETTTMGRPIQLALKLLLVTAQRRSEIVSARWDWIDEDQKTLTVPRKAVKNRSRFRPTVYTMRISAELGWYFIKIAVITMLMRHFNHRKTQSAVQH